MEEKMENTKNLRSLKQQWHSQREWCARGRLNSCASAISLLYKEKHFTLQEKQILNSAIGALRIVEHYIKDGVNTTESFNLFCEAKEENKK